MRKTAFLFGLVGILVLEADVWGATETFASWEQTYSERSTQYKILDRIFPGQLGSLSEARTDKSGQGFLFPKGGLWVKLGAAPAVYAQAAKGQTPYFAVTCMMYQQPDRYPMSAVTYFLRDTTERAQALSAGYAAYEEVHNIKLPKIGRTFLLVMSSSPGGSRGKQWDAVLYDSPASNSSYRPQTVWTSPRSLWSFQLGFNDLGGRYEYLLLKSDSKSDETFSAYRWSGDRFDSDDLASESAIEKLPPDTWVYGSMSKY